MTISFQIHYFTTWGESLRVIIGNSREIALHTTDGMCWQGEGVYERDDLDNGPTPYRYAVYRDGRRIRQEFGAIPHYLPPYPDDKKVATICVKDSWRDLPASAYRFSAAFQDTQTGADRLGPTDTEDCGNSLFVLRVLCPSGINGERTLGVAGSCASLGNWGKNRCPRMTEVRPGVWQLAIGTASLPPCFEYKYVCLDPKTDDICEWETRENRRIDNLALKPDEMRVCTEEEAFFASENYRVAGCAIPVFSLRSEGSFGVGDFGDLQTFIGWAADTGQRAVQVLPINDTTMTGTWTDSYPYSSISIYAFHPMYIDLRQLPPLHDSDAAIAFEQKRKELNDLPQVDYEAVNHWKRAYLKTLFLQEKEGVLHTEDYNRFCHDNAEWLKPYAAFCYLRDRFHTPDFGQWKEYSSYRKELADQLCAPDSETYEETAYHCYLQYVLHIQLLAACNYGRRRGVIVKGDIPIGISRTSVEAWVEPYYFNMNGQAGAPPDAFSVNGQNWGMPTYNWKAMEKDGYQWWKRRFRKMAGYFTAYRIDHILGFFRIWEIPAHAVHGLLGQFVPALPMSVAEIQNYGLAFRKDFMTRPFINDFMLEQMFGARAQWVRETFVQDLHNGLYGMRPEFDTQRKIETWFAGKDDAENMKIKENLYALVSDVLFVPDRDNPQLYHPRIAAQNDHIYLQLSQQEKEAFNRLYNDYYYRRHNNFWYDEAMKKLPALTQSTSMLVCGEDLGMVPGCVPWVMNELQILSLEIQRMPKDPQDEFGHVHAYPFRSVCTIGTHDMSTLRGWWEEDRHLSTRFFHNELGQHGEVPRHAPGWLCEDIVRRHLYCPSMLCILTWQDWTSMDESLRNPDTDMERINVPANPHHYWRWRMHRTLEDLTNQKDFNDKIKKMITDSGR